MQCGTIAQSFPRQVQKGVAAVQLGNMHAVCRDILFEWRRNLAHDTDISFLSICQLSNHVFELLQRWLLLCISGFTTVTCLEMIYAQKLI